VISAVLRTVPEGFSRGPLKLGEVLSHARAEVDALLTAAHQRVD
jgi:hypothetical protein